MIRARVAFRVRFVAGRTRVLIALTEVVTRFRGVAFTGHATAGQAFRSMRRARFHESLGFTPAVCLCSSAVRTFLEARTADPRAEFLLSEAVVRSWRRTTRVLACCERARAGLE